MTANQINFQKYLEDVRSHRKSEEISARQAGASERQAAASERQAEVAAKNSLINESAVGAQWYGAQANAAYQQAMATVSRAQQKEAVRHNVANEQQAKYQTDVTARTNLLTTGMQTRTSERNVDVQTATSERNTDVQTRQSLVTGIASPAISGILKILGG